MDTGYNYSFNRKLLLYIRIRDEEVIEHNLYGENYGLEITIDKLSSVQDTVVADVAINELDIFSYLALNHNEMSLPHILGEGGGCFPLIRVHCKLL